MNDRSETRRYDDGGILTPAAYADWYARRRADSAAGRYALILAGGRSSRMGADKPTVEVEGRTMLQRAADFWQGAGFRVLVAVGNRAHLAGQLPAGVQAIPDLVEGRGPMAGLQAGFRLTDAELLWVSGVDMPFLTQSAILPPPEGDAVIYRNGDRLEPLFGVYRRTALPVIDSLLADGVGKLRLLLERLDTRYVDAPPELAAAFRNVNTPEELLLARAGTPPLVPVTGWSGTGKTTALEGLIPALTRRGLRVCALKHDAHSFQVDKPGKDTYRLAAAGAVTVGIMSGEKWAVMGQESCTLEELRTKLPPCDLILAEGFKFSERLKIEIHRKATGRPLISRDELLLAVLTDEPLDTAAVQLGLEDYEGCADLLCRVFHLQGKPE